MPFITQGKTNLTYILIVVVLAVVVGGGVLGYYYSWIKELDAKLAELEIRLPEKVEDETADWKTYRNENYGFSIEYPSGWFAYDNKTPPCTEDIGSRVFIKKIKLEDCILGDFSLAADVIISVGPIPEVPPYGPLP